MLEWLPSALPISVGPYGLELISHDAEGVRLKFFGLERSRGDQERAGFVIETGFGFVYDQRYEMCVRAWLTAVREVFEAAAKWPAETGEWLGPMDVCATHLFEKVLKKKAAKDEAALLDAWRVQFMAFLPPRQELLDAAVELDAILTEDSTAGRSDLFSLETVGPPFAQLRKGAIFLTFRTVSWGEIDGQRAIRDVKEQECFFLSAGALSRPRVRAAFEAWRELLPRRFDTLGDTLDWQMPHDFIEPDLLELIKPQTKEDFIAVLKKRWKLESLAPQNPEDGS
ncbi:MAG: hypothetical protein JNM17_17205 [Archangium sp.]|nr:hypothetical protein [Archangium sp.]